MSEVWGQLDLSPGLKFDRDVGFGGHFDAICEYFKILSARFGRCCVDSAYNSGKER